VATYHPYVRVWEVWNEPDYTGNHAAVATWLTTPPNPDDLSHWHGTIFEYIRILRVTYEVAKAIDPACWVAVGGLGYTQFLDAILRYTDEPTSGAVAAGHEATGGAWFDCLSFHCYPMWGVSDAETGESIAGTGSDTLVRRFVTLKKNFQRTLAHYGYGSGGAYPPKLFIATETGVASKALGGFVGGDILRRNYIAKLPLLAIPAGIKQAHWFMLYDSEGSSPFGWMGDYYSLASATVNTAPMKNSTLARLAFRQLDLGSMFHSQKLSAALQGALPTNVTGVVLGNSSHQVWAVWRVCTNSELEEDTTSIQLAVPAAGNQYDWQGALQRTIAEGGATVTVTLSASPTYLLLQGGIVTDDSDGATSVASVLPFPSKLVAVVVAAITLLQLLLGVVLFPAALQQ